MYLWAAPPNCQPYLTSHLYLVLHLCLFLLPTADRYLNGLFIKKNQLYLNGKILRRTTYEVNSKHWISEHDSIIADELRKFIPIIRADYEEMILWDYTGRKKYRKNTRFLVEWPEGVVQQKFDGVIRSSGI